MHRDAADAPAPKLTVRELSVYYGEKKASAP
jgi:hypothetical protein